LRNFLVDSGLTLFRGQNLLPNPRPGFRVRHKLRLSSCSPRYLTYRIGKAESRQFSASPGSTAVLPLCKRYSKQMIHNGLRITLYHGLRRLTRFSPAVIRFFLTTLLAFRIIETKIELAFCLLHFFVLSSVFFRSLILQRMCRVAAKRS